MKPVTALTKTLALFVAVGLAAALSLAGLDALTGDRIAEQRRGYALRAVSTMLEGRPYDNDLLGSARAVEIDGLKSATAYTARLDGRPVAAVFDVTTSDGYSGDIRLLVAIDTEGIVQGVRVLEHRETPGLGDRIERERSDWLRQFEGRSLHNPPADEWASDRRDGAFDTVTGATITSSAVIAAVRQVVRALNSAWPVQSAPRT